MRFCQRKARVQNHREKKEHIKQDTHSEMRQWGRVGVRLHLWTWSASMENCSAISTTRSTTSVTHHSKAPARSCFNEDKKTEAWHGTGLPARHRSGSTSLEAMSPLGQRSALSQRARNLTVRTRQPLRPREHSTVGPAPSAIIYSSWFCNMERKSFDRRSRRSGSVVECNSHFLPNSHKVLASYLGRFSANIFVISERRLRSFLTHFLSSFGVSLNGQLGGSGRAREWTLISQR